MPEAIQFSDFHITKSAGNIEAQDSFLPQFLLLQENFKNFGLSDSKSVYFYGKKETSREVFELFRKNVVIFRRISQNIMI